MVLPLSIMRKFLRSSLSHSVSLNSRESVKGVGGVGGVRGTGDIPKMEEGVRGGLSKVWAPLLLLTPIL